AGCRWRKDRELTARPSLRRRAAQTLQGGDETEYGHSCRDRQTPTQAEGASMSAETQEKVTFAGGKASASLPISQIAIVVRDIDDALEKYHRVLGWGPWNVYEHKPPALPDTYLTGAP